VSTQFWRGGQREEDELEQPYAREARRVSWARTGSRKRSRSRCRRRRRRGRRLDHVCSPARRGSARIARLHRSRGARRRHPLCRRPALERKDIAAILTSLGPRDVLFIDEIHRLSRAAEEILYPALEDFRLDNRGPAGAGRAHAHLDLPPFTLVGATTRTGLLTTPLRDRFGLTFARALRARRAGDDRTPLGADPRLEIEDAASLEIAGRSRGTPRIANRILRAVRDVAQVAARGLGHDGDRARALELLEVDEAGLEKIDRDLLRAIVDRFDGGPVGLSTLAVALGEEQDTIEDVYEPYLLQQGFIQRTRAAASSEVRCAHHRLGSRSRRRAGSSPGWSRYGS